MRKYKRWTEDEEKVILAQVKANPQNLTRAFKLAAIKLGRTESSCSKHWYEALSKKDTNTCFLLLSKSRYKKNRKNSNTVEKTKVSKWKRILRILFE